MRLLVKVAVVGLVSYAAYRAVRWVAPQGVGSFAGTVRAGMAEREAQLKEALGLDVPADSGVRPPLTPEQARALVDDPTGSSTRPGAPQNRAPRG